MTMPEFTDSHGDRWDVAITAGTVKRLLQSPLGVDLGKPLEGDPPLLTRFSTEIAFRVDVLYLTLKPRADERGLSDEAFAERLAGDALYHASQAFLDAWCFFFQSLRQEYLARAIEKEREAEAAVMRVAVEHVSSPEFGASVSAEIDRLKAGLREDLASREAVPANIPPNATKTPGGSAASSRRSPAAGPSPEPSAS